MVRGLTVNQVYDVKVYERSSRSCRANKNVMAVVSWWWNHLKNLRSVAQSGRAPALGAGCREFESRYSDKKFIPMSGVAVGMEDACLSVPQGSRFVRRKPLALETVGCRITS